MSLTKRNTCEKCNVRLPKNRPKLVCGYCKLSKHYRCQNLSKSEAFHICQNADYEWTCYDCMAEILPINACAVVRRNKSRSTEPRFKVKCYSCNGQSYSQNNIVSCPWCDNLSHKKCVNGSLGCNMCCSDIIPGFHVHNYELYGTIGRVNDLRYNPYSLADNVNLIGDRISTEEGDNSVWNEISEILIKCNYKQLKNVSKPKHSELNVLSLNIRSLNKNLSRILDQSSEFQNYDVICFNETNCNIEKLANGVDDLLIEGFHPPIIQAPARSSCRGGGLATYIHERVCNFDEFEKLNTTQELNISGEFLFVKINKCKNVRKSLIIGNVYRSPSRNPNQFIELLESTLHNLDRHRNKHILLLGDFNFDLIKHDQDLNCQNLIDSTTNHGFIQIISRPTRVTDHSATLIDHVYSNKICNVLSSSVITFDISDHLATLTTISLDANFDNSQRPANRRNDTEQCEFRMFNEANNEKFKQLITDENWDILDGLDAEAQYTAFVDIYNKHYNTAYPLNSKRVRRKNERLQPKAWILPWLEDACNRKNLLYSNFIDSPTVANEIKYKKMKAFVDKHIRLAKKKYYAKYFEQHKSNSKKQWSMINGLLNRNKKRIGVTKLQDADGNITNTPQAIAEKFNDYFSNIASNLKSKINERSCPPTPNNFENFLTGPAVSDTMFIRPVESGEVSEIIKNMKNKATLDTKVSALKIASGDHKFTQVLAKIITSSFEQGIFPQSLKLARVVPIHKAGSKADVSNYRPISLLTSFSKIYEKLMHNRLMDFMNVNNSLHEMQYGFRAGRSCEHALLKAQSVLLDSLNKNKVSLLLLIDFSKAFDLVDHSILVKKLQHYGIRGVALDWLKSYLNNREQFVSVNGKDSVKKQIKYGVPQGSILGPLLFIIYINDIPGISKIAKFILYADDANIIISGDNINEIKEQLSTLSIALLKWVDSNGLLLNLKKTHFMIFSRQKNGQDLNLMMAGTPIQRKSEARFLGVIVDEKLNWTTHIKTIKSKMSRYIGIMYRIKSFLPKQARLQIFHSLVQSHINFCSLVWGFSTKSNIELLFTSQKKGMRAVMPGYVKYYYKDGTLPSHTKAAFSEYRVLTVQNVIARNALIFMHKVHKFTEFIPVSVSETISANAPCLDSDHVTCQEWLDIFGTSIYRKSIFFKGPLIYVDPEASKIDVTTTFFSFNSYKTSAKKLLLELQKKGDANQWDSNNFLLYNINGLRRSARLHC